jgi:serine/threonine-protein kinase HipA
MLAFDYLIGNCDNHLKNLSLTWSFDWQSKSVSPIYDITCTTVHEDLPREMGMGIGRRRLIDAIQAEDFPVMARQLGIGWRQASDALAEMAESICTAILDAAHDLDAESGVDAGSFAEKLVTDCRPRTEVALRASLLRGRLVARCR